MGEVNDSVAPWGLIEPGQLADILRSPESLQKVLLIDSRSFLEFNTCHIRQSINVCCSKLVKRRLQQDKVHIKDLLTQTCHIDADETFNVIVYDQCSENTSALTDDLFLIVLLRKLSHTFSTVTLLKGGFLGFQAMHPNLCESKTNNNYKHTALTSLSQPCLPVSNVGPTRILPFLYLGSQRDALSQETVQVNGISYILNVSTTCPQAPFIQDAHFLRIPVNDNYSEKMQPFFQQAFQFLDTVRNSNGCVLVHCLAGISRSATVAIAYIMKNLHLSSDDAYRYVKEKRPTISPNFNFLGQLLDFEKQLRREAEDTKAPATRMDLRLPASPVAKPNKCPATDHVTLARDSPNTLAVCTNPFPSAMTKSVSCSLSVASCDRVNSDWTPSVVCNQLSGAPNSMCAAVDRRTDIETDTHNIHSSKSIPETPSHLSGKVCASGDSDASSQTHVAPKRATSLPLGKSSGNRSGKTLPLRNVCSPQGAPQWLSPGPVVKSPVTQADVQSSLTQTVVQSTVLSPTTALAKLSFNSTKPSPSITMETQMQLHKFPTTSLDKLNFTPCWVREDGRKKTGGTKRPLSSSAVEGTNWDNLHSPAASSTSSSGSVSPPASHPSHAKVTLRSHSNKAKRTMARPNSIAFSSYPTFDLGSDCQNSPCSSSNTSQDDTSDTYNSKKSRPCNSEQYTEKHLYKKITAAMESAMIKTQAYGESNRKARSLDDILNSGDEEAMDTDCNCNSKLGRISRRCGPRNDLFTATNVLEQLACRCRGTSDPYQSNSSISSSGSHSSLHGSLEIIQPPR